MNLAKMDKEQKADYERRLARNYGKLVEIEWQDFVKGEVVAKTNTYYVGRLTAGITGQVVQTLGGMLGNLQNLGEGGAAGLLESLTDDKLEHLLAVLIRESDAWVHENFSLKWALQVLDATLEYNDFFELLPLITSIAQKMATSAEASGLVEA